MSIALLFLLALVAAALISLPLLRRPLATLQPDSGVTGEVIDQAVLALRRNQNRAACPACGRPHQLGDRFCVGCGASLVGVTPEAPACPSCGAPQREGDQFCAKCGQVLPGTRGG